MDIKAIKYNRTVLKFNRVLDNLSTNSSKLVTIPIYHTDYYHGSCRIFSIRTNIRKISIDFEEIYWYGFDYGLDNETIKDIIEKRFNKYNYAIE